MNEIPSSEPSNKRPLILLIIAVVILVILIGVWQWSGFGGGIFNKAKRPKPLTEAEKAQITAENKAIMLQFATAATPTAETMKKEEQKNIETMELFSPAAPIVGTKEGKENYNIMKLFQ